MGLRITKEEFNELVANGAIVGPHVKMPGEEGGSSPEQEPVAKVGRGQHEPGKMNKLESRYAAYLEERRLASHILLWRFEAVKLKLATKTYYTPDFMVMMPNGMIEFHEVKGFWRDDARVKIKVAASMFPFTFIAVERTKRGWVLDALPAS